MSDPASASGGCLCGAVRYRYPLPLGAANYCHCVDCRRVTGSAFNIGIRLEQALLQISGVLRSYSHAGGSGQAVERLFCGQCGSPLFTRHPARPESVWVRAGGLDDPALVQPGWASWASQRVAWAVPPEGLTEFPRNRISHF
ncbi:Uncharacterized conserved protein [Andreprevotia lacus DSM 23236]|uniref:Uncharacterized conserved protein n=1 Tax=Andreprevotia lacus DSM 23236 TaxID=1121001 RepID=A0A1W1XEY1_9NEIS|nr:GFA family protein [Andreprevotia lacus]SMC22615.1 Uncharacterized conserved protein [Andreprevotia lacus DSM 23236]